MIIYLFCGEHRDKGETLIRRALAMYGAKKQCCGGADFSGLRILRTERGKPYTEEAPFYFSVSHTGKLWGCAVSTLKIGLDIQEIRRIDFERLSKRFFLEEEAAFVRMNGIVGFFDLWTRKEACVKYHGTGLGDIKGFSVVKNGEPANKIWYNGESCLVRSFDLEEEVKCAFCCAEEKEAEKSEAERAGIFEVVPLLI